MNKRHVMMKDRNETKMINETQADRRLVPCILAAFSANKVAVGALALLLGGGFTALAAGTGNDNRAPEVPDGIVVPDGNKVHFHAFAVGFQIYTWDGASWGPAVPEAVLFHGEGVVAIHFAGPTWESNSGSKVVGALPPKSAIVDTNAIPWLRLSAKSTEGPGIFADTSFIQRVNTSGGKAPSADGAFIGQVARVPYTADYYFYRQTNN
jgi:uncharacterized protein DUF3455